MNLHTRRNFSLFFAFQHVCILTSSLRADVPGWLSVTHQWTVLRMHSTGWRGSGWGGWRVEYESCPGILPQTSDLHYLSIWMPILSLLTAFTTANHKIPKNINNNTLCSCKTTTFVHQLILIRDAHRLYVHICKEFASRLFIELNWVLLQFICTELISAF